MIHKFDLENRQGLYCKLAGMGYLAHKNIKNFKSTTEKSIVDLGMKLVGRCFKDVKKQGGTLTADDLDMIIFATDVYDYPSLADNIKTRLKEYMDSESNAGCHDLVGDNVSLAIKEAMAFINIGMCKAVLVICATKEMITFPELEIFSGNYLLDGGCFALLLQGTNITTEVSLLGELRGLLNRQFVTKHQYCQLTDLGHSGLLYQNGLRFTTQLEFIKSLSSEAQQEVFNKFKNKEPLDKDPLEKAAEDWGRMIGPGSIRFNGNGDVVDLGMLSVRECLDDNWSFGNCVNDTEIDLIIGSTNTFSGRPSLAHQIKKCLGDKCSADCYDVVEACAGGIGAMIAANALIMSGFYKKVLVVCSEKATDLIARDSWEEGSNLFGDGSSACLFQGTDDAAKQSITAVYWNSFPYNENLYFVQKTADGFLQNGREVHKIVLDIMPKIITELIQTAELKLNESSFVIFHQPSYRTSGALKDKILADLPSDLPDIVYTNEMLGNHTGNISSAGALHVLSVLNHQLDREWTGNAGVIFAFGSGIGVTGAVLRF